MQIKKQYSNKTYRTIEFGDYQYSGTDNKDRSVDYIFRLLPSDEFRGKKVLDLGCAAGAVLFRSLDFGIQKGLGVDFEPRRIEIGNQIIRDHNIPSLKLINQDLESFLQEKEELFDIVFLLNILHHFSKPLEILKQAIKWAQDWLIIEYPDSLRYKPVRYEINPEKETSISMEEIISELEKSRFRLIKQEISECENFAGGSRSLYLFQKFSS
ncbi:MAG: class I SAM-dependent methyltransferase [Leptospiraceae bacterium]|nr:class I SAM-dependent methyltransferase [Leptospiraceae bacterium]MCP5503131.1 class I SAM-dependent methyltransferase [Leptospiraceae bacterium]